ncbi:unnamed protein product [Strongylus vulgaris]|uniref:Uncharacterized protein n=1 Tax=Strongylus vulgaris TaxID=40348 RepID=A0A3P7M1P4_STRVU|nr:unnamed protein product [Strongylus vulgaris]
MAVNTSTTTASTSAPTVLAEELRKVLIRLGDMRCGDHAVSPDEFFQSVWKISPRFRVPPTRRPRIPKMYHGSVAL